MPYKQESITEDASALIDNIAKLYSAMNLPRMADSNLYVGIPYSILGQMHQALTEQFECDVDKRFFNRMRYAGLSREYTEPLFLWDDDMYPHIEPGVIEKVLSLDFVRDHRNVFIGGPSGTGKTLLATILVSKALRSNFSAKYTTSFIIASKLKEVQDISSRNGYTRKMRSCDLLVIEDLEFSTYKDMDGKLYEDASYAFLSIIDERLMGRKSTIITSNGSILEWARELPNQKMAPALIGRFVEHAILVNMNGAKDMRMRHAKEMFDSDAKEPSNQD